jgi:ABC-2 type transport system permease protein
MGKKSWLVHSFWICWKDLLDFARSRMSLAMLIIMPIFMMVMVGFIFPDNVATIEDVPIAIADLDDGVMGDAFLTQLGVINDNTGMMELSSATDLEDIRSYIYEGSIDGGIILGEDFTESIMNGSQGDITIITDQSNPQISLQITTVLTMTIEQMGTQSAMMSINQTYGIPLNYTLAVIKPYVVETEGLIPGDPSYFQFVAPGIIAMVVMMALMTGLPHAISYEKDTGTLDGMLVAPIRRLSIIFGKVLAQTTRGMVQGLIILVLAILLFGVTVYGSLVLVFLIMFLTVFSFVGLGILITSFTDKEETATMVMMTLMFPMMFMSGVFFPIEQMPGIMQTIANFLPLTYATTALRKVMVLGAGFPDITAEILFMVIFGIVFLLIAVPMFKKAMNR